MNYLSYISQADQKEMYANCWLIAALILVIVILMLKEPRESESQKEQRLIKERSADFAKVRDSFKSEHTKSLFFLLWCHFDDQRYQVIRNSKPRTEKYRRTPNYLPNVREEMRKKFELINEEDKQAVYEFANRWYPSEVYYLKYVPKEETEDKK